MQGIAVWERRRQRRRKCRSSWILIWKKTAASRVADKGTGFAMQFEYRRHESSMLITEQNTAVSFARCLPFVLITTCHSLVTRLSIIATACQRYGVSYRVGPNQWCDYRNSSIKIKYMVGAPFWFGIVQIIHWLRIIANRQRKPTLNHHKTKQHYRVYARFPLHSL